MKLSNKSKKLSIQAIEKHLRYYHKQFSMESFKSFMIYESDRVAQAALNLGLLENPLDIEYAKSRVSKSSLEKGVSDKAFESGKLVFSLVAERLIDKHISKGI